MLTLVTFLKSRRRVWSHPTGIDRDCPEAFPGKAGSNFPEGIRAGGGTFKAFSQLPRCSLAEPSLYPLDFSMFVKNAMGSDESST